jgi:hypothetical protein
VTSIIAAAPATVQGVQGGHIAGPMTLSGLSLVCALVMVAGLRKSDRAKFLHHRDGAASWGILTGSVWLAAGASWAAFANSVAQLPTSVLGNGGGSNNAGGTALALTVLAFVWPWKRMIIPTILGIAAAGTYATAGGAWGVAVNAVRMSIGHYTGGA